MRPAPSKILGKARLFVTTSEHEIVASASPSPPRTGLLSKFLPADSTTQICSRDGSKRHTGLMYQDVRMMPPSALP
jgi:hypothetical protein